MQYLAPDSVRRARRIRLAIFDFDGTLTDGRTWFGSGGEEMKALHAFDGEALQMLHAARIQTAVITTGEIPSAEEHAKALHIRYVLQNVEDKRAAFRQLLASARMSAERAAYMGDDLVDLAILTRCGFAAVPRGAPEEVRRAAHFISSARAGRGAAREVCEFLLLAQDKLKAAVDRHRK
jgi:3-deoxy-D-manno-octulosonate 8-phosphate phosphatase (KDO 8-P phosphatase)